MIEDLQVLEPLATGDHCKILFQLITETEANGQKVDRWMFKKADYDAINQFLASFEWDHIFKDKNVNEKWTELKMVLQNAIKNKFLNLATNVKSKNVHGKTTRLKKLLSREIDCGRNIVQQKTTVII